MSTQVSASRNRTGQILNVVQRHWIEILAWIAFAVFWIPTFHFFYLAWDNPDGYYSHGFLIPFM